MLVSGIWQSVSVYTYIHSFSDSFPIEVITEYLVEFPVLCSRSLLIISLLYAGLGCSVLSNSLQPYGLYSPPGSSVHGILQERVLQWVTMPYSGGSSQPRESNPGLPHCGWILYWLSHQRSPRTLEWVAVPPPGDLLDPGTKPGFPALHVDSLPAELPGKSVLYKQCVYVNSKLPIYPSPTFSFW